VIDPVNCPKPQRVGELAIQQQAEMVDFRSAGATACLDLIEHSLEQRHYKKSVRRQLT